MCSNFDSVFDEEYLGDGTWLDDLDNMSMISLSDAKELNEQSLSISEHTKPEKRKKSLNSKQAHKSYRVNKYTSTIPRAISDDIRYTYSAMFMNMFNAFTYPQWFNYFNTYCTSDLLLIESSPKSMRPNLPKYVEILGAKLSSQFMFNRMQIIPDAILRLNKTKMFTRSDNSESRIVSSFVITGTKLYDVSLAEMLPPQLQIKEGVVSVEERYKGGEFNHNEKKQSLSDLSGLVYNDLAGSPGFHADTTSAEMQSLIASASDAYSRAFNNSSSSHDTALVDDQAVRSYQNIIDHCPLLEHPLEVTVQGTITMHLDCNKRIRKFEFNTTNKVIEIDHLNYED